MARLKSPNPATVSGKIKLNECESMNEWLADWMGCKPSRMSLEAKRMNWGFELGWDLLSLTAPTSSAGEEILDKKDVNKTNK